MPDPQRRIYWDASVFLSYINGYADRAPTIETLLDEAQRGDFELLTSALSTVEVSFAAAEQQRQRLSPDVEAKIDQLWLPPSPVKLVEFYALIGEGAKALMRAAITRGWSLKPMDAIHLSTARRLGVSEFHTYDQGLQKYRQDVGCPIREPFTTRPRLPGT